MNNCAKTKTKDAGEKVQLNEKKWMLTTNVLHVSMILATHLEPTTMSPFFRHPKDQTEVQGITIVCSQAPSAKKMKQISVINSNKAQILCHSMIQPM